MCLSGKTLKTIKDTHFALYLSSNSLSKTMTSLAAIEMNQDVPYTPIPYIAEEQAVKPKPKAKRVKIEQDADIKPPKKKARADPTGAGERISQLVVERDNLKKSLSTLMKEHDAMLRKINQVKRTTSSSFSCYPEPEKKPVALKKKKSEIDAELMKLTSAEYQCDSD